MEGKKKEGKGGVGRDREGEGKGGEERVCLGSKKKLITALSDGCQTAV